MGISRRDFVKGAAAFGAGAAFCGGRAFGMMGGPGGGGMGGGMGGSAVIDPPVGPAFVDLPTLPNVSSTAGEVHVKLEAKLATIPVAGQNTQLMTYNGMLPGGIIRAKKGQVLKVDLTNSLPDDGKTNILGHGIRATNLHTHGLHVTPGMAADGRHGDDMMVRIEPGETVGYTYDLGKQFPGTLNFYHPHIHGCVADQMWSGMYGPLIVDDEVTALAPYETHVMMLKDISVSGGLPVPRTSAMQYHHGLEGGIVLVNGQVNPRLKIRPGQVQRWRICNASTARFYRLALDRHTMYVVGTEAGLLDRPYPVTELLLSPGERVELLIKADRSAASYKFYSLPYSRTGMMTSAQITLLTLTYSGTPNRQNLPVAVDPAAKRMAMDTSMLPKKTLTLSMGMSAGYINGIQFTDHEHCDMQESHLGHHEVWEIVNPSNMDHPFHHHVNRAQVLSISGGDAKYASLMTATPAWKDVTIVPKGGSVRLLMEVSDYGGHTMYHCHIIDHEDIGMMGMWHIMDHSMPMP